MFVFQWYGIMLDYVGEYEGIKERISKAYKIKEHFVVRRLMCFFDLIDIVNLVVHCRPLVTKHISVVCSERCACSL